jgi:hypothetical protein
MEVLWIIALIVGACYAMYVYKLFVFYKTVDALQVFLSSPNWRTIEDCREAKFDEDLTKIFSGIFYKQKILKVRLQEKVRTCQISQIRIYVHVMKATAVPLRPGEADELSLHFVNEHSPTPFDYFEANLFSAATADMFEFRIEYKGHPRRKYMPALKFQFPARLIPKPA